MPVHIGKIIQAEVAYKRLTQKEFGALIYKNEKTVPDIYARATISIDLLITISAALKKDFLCIFYNEEPMKSLRNDEIAALNLQVQKFIEEIQKIKDENSRLHKELALTKELAEARNEIISLAKEQIEQYKLKLTERLSKSADKSTEAGNNSDHASENEI